MRTAHVVDLNERPSVNHGLRKRLVESADATLPLRDNGRRLAVNCLNLFEEEALTALRFVCLNNEKRNMRIAHESAKAKRGRYQAGKSPSICRLA